MLIPNIFIIISTQSIKSVIIKFFQNDPFHRSHAKAVGIPLHGNEKREISSIRHVQARVSIPLTSSR